MHDLYCDMMMLYNKVHSLHIKTVKMNGTATLHETLGEHYETLEGIVDSLGEDILIKHMNKEVPMLSECLKTSTIKDNMMYDDSDEIIEDLYKDYEYMLTKLKSCTKEEKDLLVQNILIDLRNTFTKLCADISREMCEKVKEKKENKQEKVENKPKLGIKTY